MNPSVRSPKSVSGPLAIPLVLLLALSLSGCATLGLGGVNLISIEDEWEMGRQFEAELAEELPLVDDAVVNEYVNEIGRLLVSQTEMADLEWRFYVVEDPQVNAFNVPGGLVYVYTGLIEQAGSAAEFIGVMGHEVGHGVARHGTERLSQQYGLALLASAVLGEEPGFIRQIVAEIAAFGAIASFSRAQEFEADDIGVVLMLEAGYHPRGMVDLLERLLDLREREPGTVERFFATHPDVSDRINRVEERMTGLDGLGGLQMNDQRFQAVQDRVR